MCIFTKKFQIENKFLLFYNRECRGFGFVTFETDREAAHAIEDHNKTEFDGKQITVELSKRNKAHKPTPGAYLGPTSATSRGKRGYSPPSSHRRKYRSRSRSRSRSYRNSHHRSSRNYSRSRSRS